METPEHEQPKPKSALPHARAGENEANIEDVAYTVNLAVACTLTDWIDPIIGNWSQKLLGKRIQVHDHGHHDHEGHAHGHDGHLGKWAIAEFVGDYGAVPVTLAFQRWAPGFMKNIQFMLEPVMGPLFRRGAHSAAKEWAKKNGLAENSEASKQYEQSIYGYEVSQLPLFLMWNASAIALNLGMQRALGNPAPWSHLAIGKLSGAAISSGVAMVPRMIAPEHAGKFDRWTEDTILMPIAENFGHLLGVKKEDIKRSQERKEARERGDAWTKRVGETTTEPNAPAVG